MRPNKAQAIDLAQLNAGMRRTGPDSSSVTYEGLTKALTHLTALRRSGRFKWKTEGGRMSGLELVRIRPDSPLEHLGLQRGDVVRKLNGNDLAAAVSMHVLAGGASASSCTS